MEQPMEKLNPQEYFAQVKERRHTIADAQLKQVYDNCLELLNKYNVTGQKNGMRKLMFHMRCIERERALVAMGIDTFVYRDDIEYYIEEVADDVVKIIDIESYEREIPDEIVSVIERVKDKFDQLYIVFTDYTGKVERQVQKERRSKDPILFGAFVSEKDRVVNDRFYYLGDWEDEYCDLTLDKMVNEVKNVGKRNIQHTISTPEDMQALKNQLGNLSATSDVSHFVVSNIVSESDTKKPGFFARVKTFLSRKKS